jgi:hypothetical protein
MHLTQADDEAAINQLTINKKFISVIQIMMSHVIMRSDKAYHWLNLMYPNIQKDKTSVDGMIKHINKH